MLGNDLIDDFESEEVLLKRLKKENEELKYRLINLVVILGYLIYFLIETQ